MSESTDRGRRLAWRIGIGVAVVAVASLGAIGIAAATSSSPDTSSAPAPSGQQHDEHGGHGPWGGGRGGGPWGHGGGGGPFGAFADAFGDMDIADMSHATVVLAKKGGGSQTLTVQKGAVTSVDGGSIALKSADGYAKTYAVNKDTKVSGDDEKIASVAKDEQVVVVSKDSGDKPAATVVVDLSDLGWK
jgi:hypothetical protein